MDNAKKGEFGEIYVKDWLLKKKLFAGVEIANCNGGDLFGYKKGKRYLIEVKTTKTSNGGIPDMHDKEFKKSGKRWFFVADYLCVVRLTKNDKVKQVDWLTRKEVDQFSDRHTTLTRIRTAALQTAIKNKTVGKVYSV